MKKALAYLSMVVVTCGSMTIGGCVTGTAVQTGEHSYPPRTDWATVKILFEKPAQPYEVIGPVSALGAPAAEERAVYDMLRQQGAKLGADAVLMDTPGSVAYADGFRNGKKNAGLAIKFSASKAHHGI